MAHLSFRGALFAPRNLFIAMTRFLASLEKTMPEQYGKKEK
jgi:hypothetical protein